jgi:hypothetical protein
MIKITCISGDHGERNSCVRVSIQQQDIDYSSSK